jgi:flavorubredoxin
MVVRELRPGVFSVGAIDWNRRLFDSLIPLPHGTSYNAYLVRGSEKTVLIDTVDPTMEFELVCNLVRLGIDRIDYIIVNHAEQDHSGALPMMMELFPQATVLATEKCVDLLVQLLHVPAERCHAVADKETLLLGDRTLEFIHAPYVHWPETMLTLLREDHILFPCDLFGSHLATSDLFVRDERLVYLAAKRYYAEIMMPFRKSIQGHLARLEPLGIELIAPSHGPVHDRPSFIMDAYRDWISEEVKNEAVIVYTSMHGSTGKMADYLAGALIDRGITVRQFEMTVADIGELAMAFVDAATVVIGTPTTLFGPHPQLVYAAYLANLLKPKTRYVSVIGSYGWGGAAVEQLKGMLSHLKVQVLDPVYIRGAPQGDDLKALDRLADDILGKHRADGLLTAA